MLDPLPPEMEQLLSRRRRLGLDGYDEVWEGTYHMAPMSRGRHGWLQFQVAEILGRHARAAGLVGVGPFNLGDGPDDFRVPDLGFLRDLDPATLYLPTAALVVEVVSPGDETYDKFGFYADHRVDELLVVDPGERRVSLHALAGESYERVDHSCLLGIEVAGLAARLRWSPTD